MIDKAKNNAELETVIQRSKYILNISQSENWLLVIAFDHLNLALAYQALQQTETARTEFYLAIRGIQKAGSIDNMPKFYLTRADFYLTQNKLNEAKDDLNSALEIIERCGMKLYQVDYCLIHGRYCLKINDNETALNNYQKAQLLITETGYHLRDAELDLLAAQICQHTNQDLNSKTADDYLQKAKNRIEKIGQWGLLRVIERDFS